MKTLFTFLLFALAFTKINGQTLPKFEAKSSYTNWFETDSIHHTNLSELPFKPTAEMNAMTIPFKYFCYIKRKESPSTFILIRYYQDGAIGATLVILIYDLKGNLIQ
ncbi:MAG: hypothetical protein NT150_09295 [Bacteroidetes bacterium]|nr:hypothetical protein [Bacteroidota bacterium]